MNLRRSCIFFALLFTSFPVTAQETIFPGMYGQELLDNLKASYKPIDIHSYNLARDRMYGFIDNHGDSVHCVYSDYTVYVPYGISNPRDYTNSYNPIINAEHTWPQSLGATGTAKNDLHHLFPNNADVNSARGNFPFDEVPDSQTDLWYFETTTQGDPPDVNIDAYSELDSGVRFEPREDHKGNVARAMFYFYTMYKDQADAEDPTYFDDQKEALRDWNMLDPVNPAEITRTEAIASYQEGKVNPFVIDTTLIGRAYFGVTTGISADEDQGAGRGFELFQNYPNPFNPTTDFGFRISDFGFVEVRIFDVRGTLIKTVVSRTMAPGNYSASWDGTNNAGEQVASGVYIYQLSDSSRIQSRKLLLLR